MKTLITLASSALVEVQTYHVVAGDVSARDAITAGKAESLQHAKLDFRIEDGRLLVNDSVIVANDVEASNGTIHAIDTVLLPPGELGIDRHASLLLTDITSGNPAESAGLRKYDLATSVDGAPATAANLRKAKERAGYGGTVSLVIVRRGEPRYVNVGVDVDPH